MKKVISLLLVVVMVCIMATSAVFAAEPRWSNVLSIIPTISASSDSFGLNIHGVPGTTKIQCDMTLYKKGLLGETQVGHRSSIYYGDFKSFTASATINTGSTYRLEATIKVTTNGYTETINYEYEQAC